MTDTSGPYRPARQTDATQEANCLDSLRGNPKHKVSPFALVVFPVCVGVFGFFGYIALALWLTPTATPERPVLSHGQQAVLISLPLCTVIAASIGFALAFVAVRLKLIAMGLLTAIALLGWIATRFLWNNQISSYGRDPSEAVLYYPPAAYAALSLCLAIIVGVSLPFSTQQRG